MLAAIILTLRLADLWPVTARAEEDLTAELTAGFEKQVSQQPDLTRIDNAVTINDIKALSLNRELITTFNSDFNARVEGSRIVDQKGTGRCRMIAGTNVLTPRMMAKSKLKDFRLSLAYLPFWQKAIKGQLLFREHDQDSE